MPGIRRRRAAKRHGDRRKPPAGDVRKRRGAIGIGPLLPWAAMALAAVAAGLLVASVRSPFDLRALRDSVDAIVEELATSPLVEQHGATIAVFLTGMIAGVLPALWWANHRVRWQPLLLVDHRSPDMTLGDLLSHVRQRTAGSEPEAIRLIVEAAIAGSLSVWRRGASNAVLRMPRRLIEVALVRQSEQLPGPRSARRDMFFFRAEVSALWPDAASLLLPARAATRAHGR